VGQFYHRTEKYGFQNVSAGSGHCRISLTCFLAKCLKKRHNQASYILLCFLLFAFYGLSLVFVLSVFDLCSVMYFPVCTSDENKVIRIAKCDAFSGICESVQ